MPPGFIIPHTEELKVNARMRKSSLIGDSKTLYESSDGRMEA